MSLNDKFGCGTWMVTHFNSFNLSDTFLTCRGAFFFFGGIFKAAVGSTVFEMGIEAKRNKIRR
jgi:hypothetical protein